MLLTNPMALSGIFYAPVMPRASPPSVALLTRQSRLHNILGMNDPAQLAEHIVRILQQNGHQAVFAGGCVRDMVMGRQPTDFDIATSARPEQVRRLFPKSRLVGASFGVVVVLVDDHQFEVATFRSEGDYRDGRHPTSVRFTTAEDDVQRRDFTINGLLYDPVTAKVLDYVAGQADIKGRLVRTIGDAKARFSEDRLRLIRAVRFAAFLDFDIEPATRAAIAELAPKVTTISPERIADELRKILTRHGASRGVRLLREVGLLRQILPEVEAMVGVEQPPSWHPEGDVFTHSLLALDFLENPSFELAMSTLLHDVGKPPTIQRGERTRYPHHESVGARIADAICQRLRLSNDSRHRIVWLVKRHMVFVGAEKMRLSTQKRLFAEPGFDELLALHKADVLASTSDLAAHRYTVNRRRELTQEKILPPPLVTGHDLIAMGVRPGPVFKQILAQIRDEQLEEKIHTREAGLQRARDLVEQMRTKEHPP